MNCDTANAIYGYLETLYLMNQRLIKLSGMEAIEDNCKILLDIVQDIPRIIPYKYNNKIKKLELNNEDGLLELYKDIILDLKTEYDNILKENHDFLDKVRRIRNKYEHKMHGVKYKSSISGGCSLIEFQFVVNENNLNIKAKEFIPLVSKVNSLFSKIVNEIKEYAKKNKKTEYPYYRKICIFDFEDFNKIYKLEDLRIVGRCMKEF